MKASSPSVAERSLIGSRVAGLQDTRRWLLLLLLSEAWLFAALVGALRWRVLSGFDRFALLASAIAIVLGWVLSRRAVGLWFVMGGPLLLVIATLVNGGAASEAQWIAVSTSAGHVAFALVLLCSPAWGIAAIVGSTVALAVSWSLRPGNVVPGALLVADGRIALLSLDVTAFVLWLAWNVLMRRARLEDASRARLAERIQAEREKQERTKALRAAAVTVHERLLSTLRYLIQAPTPDREGLRTLIATSEPFAFDGSGEDLEHSVRVATAARIASGIVQLDTSVIDLPVTDATRAAGRAAIVECALNAVLHGGATEVKVAGEHLGDIVRIHVTDNGKGIAEDALPGLGWTSVIEQGLAEVDGTWSFTSEPGHTLVTLTMPSASAHTTSSIVDDGFSQGRTLLAAPLLATGAVGIAFNVIGLPSGILSILIVALVIAAIVMGAVVIVRGKRPSLLNATWPLLFLAATPWLASLAVPTGAAMQAVAPGMVTSGYALIAIALWCRRWQFIAGLTFWAVGMVALTAHTAPDQRQPLLIGLVNCLVIVPVVVVVSSIATKRFRRAQDELLLQREAMNTAVVRANAASLIESQLSACVAQSESIIARIADGADLDDAVRHELACLEGLIRATIQVDPVASGEFARVAARLCNTAFSKSIPAQVGTLISSSDSSPLPSALVKALEEAIGSADSVTVRAMTLADEDHLSLHLHGGSLDAQTLATFTTDRLQGVSLDTEEEPGKGVLVLVGRRLGDASASVGSVS
ncbi:unannotated protein [freshwater metagenome]|uniref:Unannotated protein n=1 Tax=freshwater metagenome TaxID=449393 RepID=A0A6J7H5F6_9ZZZZ